MASWLKPQDARLWLLSVACFWIACFHPEMRFLVTGGAGFIGTNFLLATVPHRSSDEFLNVDLLTYAANPQNLAPLEGARNYRFARLDLREKDEVLSIVKDYRPDIILHFAAESHVDRSILGPIPFVQTNVLGTLHLLEAARFLLSEGRSVLFHHVSTDEVYGSLGETGYFTETTAYAPSSPYSASKAASDHLVRAYHHTYGLRVRITNCSNNYGPYQFPEKLIPLMIQNALKGLPLPVYGEGLNVRDWLYVNDHVSALLQVLEKGRDGATYNVGGNAEARNIDLVRSLCRILAEETGKPEKEYLGLISFVKDRPGHDLRYAIDASRLRSELGWKPEVTLEEGLRRTVRWYLSNGDWVRAVTSGEYQNWILENYGKRSQA